MAAFTIKKTNRKGRETSYSVLCADKIYNMYKKTEKKEREIFFMCQYKFTLQKA